MAAQTTAFAFLRIGRVGIHHLGGRGVSSDLLFLVGLVFAAVLVLALTRPRQEHLG